VARLTPVDPRVMDRALRKLGFARVRQRGSHVFYRHPDGRTTTVPHHKRRDLAVPLVRAIWPTSASHLTTSCACSNPSHCLGSGSFAPTPAETPSNPAGLGFVRARVRSASRPPGATAPRLDARWEF
jgi:predicted RNA binding protein YcfA (HicA-like mRNA interferase family)